MSSRKNQRSLPLNGTPATGKKRKASALSEDHEPVKTPKSANAKTPRGKSQTHKSTPQASTVTDDVPPFTVECPVKPTSAKNAKPLDDVFTGREEAIASLAIDYAVRPGSRWTSMRSYKNLKLSTQVFSTGSILYINRKSPAPTPPDDDAPAAEVLKWDRENLWVGRVLECRAADERSVYVRVFWLYWPEELPMRRQPYHSDKELIMSNAMDIVDAQSIASAAEVSTWDEFDEDGDTDLNDRFWRQTFDVSKIGKLGKGGLSEVRRHCTCGDQYNPDQTMYKCVNEGCGIWCHEECLVEHALDKTYQAWIDGTLGQEKKQEQPSQHTVEEDKPTAPPITNPRSPLKRLFPAEKVGELLNATRRMLTPDTVGTAEKKDDDTTVEIRSDWITWTRKPAKAAKPWANKFSAQVFSEDADSGKGKVLATITDLTKKAKKDRKEWTQDVRCLKCGTVME